MALKVPTASEITILKVILNVLPAEDLVVRLYTNDVTPGDADTAASYVEASGGGYAPKTLTPADWTFSTTGDGKGQGEQPVQEWVFTGPLDGNASIYGYFVTHATSGTLLWAERDPEVATKGAFTPANNGDTYRITPKFTLASET